MSLLEQGRGPSGWAGSHLARAEAPMTGSQAAWRGTGVSGVSPHARAHAAGLVSVPDGTRAGWTWSVPGACLRQLVSLHEVIQNREFGAKELKWEGEF